MYLYTHVFLAVLGLCCGLFSSCSEQGLLSSWGAWASHCGGFSCSLVVEHRAGKQVSMAAFQRGFIYGH